MHHFQEHINQDIKRIIHVNVVCTGWPVTVRQHRSFFTFTDRRRIETAICLRYRLSSLVPIGDPINTV